MRLSHMLAGPVKLARNTVATPVTAVLCYSVNRPFAAGNLPFSSYYRHWADNVHSLLARGSGKLHYLIPADHTHGVETLARHTEAVFGHPTGACYHRALELACQGPPCQHALDAIFNHNGD